MEPALEHLSKHQLIALLKERGQPVLEQKNTRLEEELAYYKAQVEMYRRMQFGQRRERFEADSAQLLIHP